jgi:hypothetical protein
MRRSDSKVYIGEHFIVLFVFSDMKQEDALSKMLFNFDLD